MFQETVQDAPCEPQVNIYSQTAFATPEYARTGPVTLLFHEYIDEFFPAYTGCQNDAANDHLTTFRTSRFTDETDATRANLAADLNAGFRQPLERQTDLRRYEWLLGDGSPRTLNVFAGTMMNLSDGRVAVLTTLTETGVSPYPDGSWQDVTSAVDTTTPVVNLYILAQTQNLLVAEVVTLCAGTS